MRKFKVAQIPFSMTEKRKFKHSKLKQYTVFLLSVGNIGSPAVGFKRILLYG